MDQKYLFEALKKAIAYFDKVLLTEPATITKMELAYVGYFGKDEEDVVIPIITPAWFVAAKEGGTYYTLVYDAFEGTILDEGILH